MTTPINPIERLAPERATDAIDRALATMLRRSPGRTLRFNPPVGGASVVRMSDEDLVRDLKITMILTDPELTPRERVTQEQRTRLYDYAHMLRSERARRRETGGAS